MKLLVIYLSVLVGCVGLVVLTQKSFKTTPCWCWSLDQGVPVVAKPYTPSKEYVSYGSYGSEADWNNPQRIISLGYQQAQGKRIFYEQCVWCHADTTPAGPSNRTNVTPTPPLINDGTVFNALSDASLREITTLGGSAVGKSAMMPPYGGSLSQEDISDLIAYIRAVAVPEYHNPSGPALKSWRSKGL